MQAEDNTHNKVGQTGAPPSQMNRESLIGP